MGANQKDHEDVRTAALVKIGAALDAQAVIARCDFEFRLRLAVENHQVNPKYAKKLSKSLDDGLQKAADAATEVMSMFTENDSSEAKSDIDDIMNKARAEQEEADEQEG